MLRPGCEVDDILQALLAEHRKLLDLVVRQQAAMAALDAKALEDVTRLQDSCRLRIVALESKRRQVVAQAARALKLDAKATLPQLAARDGVRGPGWLKLRDELKTVIDQLAKRTHIAGRVAGAVLGHLNTVVRLLAGAVERAGLYTKAGVPRVSARIGVMEAVG